VESIVNSCGSVGGAAPPAPAAAPPAPAAAAPAAAAPAAAAPAAAAPVAAPVAAAAPAAPAVAPAPPPAAGASCVPAGDGWWKKEDPTSNRSYYVHERTGKCQWEKPTASDVVNKPPQSPSFH